MASAGWGGGGLRRRITMVLSLDWLKNLGRSLFGGRQTPANDTAPADGAGPSYKTGPANPTDPKVKAASAEVAAPYADGPAAQAQVVDQEGLKEAGLRKQPSDIAQQQGRENRTDWLAVNEFD